MSTPAPPNLLLVTIDCLRPDHIGAYGYKRPTTPHLDALAREGVRFTRVISQGPCTRVSFSAMLSSVHPGMLGGFQRISPQRRMLAEILRDAGYHTAAFGSNPYLSPIYGYDKGFQLYDNNLVPWIQTGEPWPIKHLNRLFILGRCRLAYLPAKPLTNKAVRFLRDHGGAGPWFVWVHYMDVHDPYRPPRRHASRFQRVQTPALSGRALWQKALNHPEAIGDAERRYLIDLYDAEIHYADEQIGRLLTTLRETGALDSTLVIVTADHGEEFGEHGQFSHRHRVFNELLRVPLLTRLPERLPAGRTVETQVRLLDLVPTALDLLDLTDGPFEGESLLPLIERRDVASKVAISETHPKAGLYAIQQADWKLILDAYTGERELYHLQEDPGETRNCADMHPSLVSALEVQLRAHLARIGKRPAETDVQLDSFILDRLRALGYVD